jgi:predicted nuclease of predicted toxin-antitoxin system
MRRAVKFYADEHISKAVIRGMRTRGIDVMTVSDASMRSASDEAHMAYAASRRRVIITQDDDFLRLAAKASAHPGIVYAPQHTSPGDIIRGLLLIAQVLNSEDMDNHIEFLPL